MSDAKRFPEMIYLWGRYNISEGGNITIQRKKWHAELYHTEGVVRRLPLSEYMLWRFPNVGAKGIALLSDLTETTKCYARQLDTIPRKYKWKVWQGGYVYWVDIDFEKCKIEIEKEGL